VATISLTDWDEKNTASVGTLSDSSSFTGLNKVQPIKVVPKKFVKEKDGFEDADRTSNPQWTVTETGGSDTVQTGTVKNGTYALEFSIPDGSGGRVLSHDRGSNDTVNSGDTYETWINTGNTSDSSVIEVANGNGFPVNTDGIEAGINNGSFVLASSTTGEKSFGSPNSNTWYKISITIYPSSSSAHVSIEDSNGNKVASESISTSGASNLQYVNLNVSEGSSGATVYYDDVSYSTTTVSDNTGGGTGDAVFNNSTWDNITAANDLVVTESDESTTRPYEIESLDTTSREAWLWVYGSWDSDDSDQLVVGAGTGDGTDYSIGGTGVNPWDQTGINALLVQHLQDDPLTATDSSPNNNDGTVTGATSRSGEFDGAGNFDGTDDYINFGNFTDADGMSEITVVSWAEADTYPSDENEIIGKEDEDAGTDSYRIAYDDLNSELQTVLVTDSGGAALKTGKTLLTGTTYFTSLTWSSSSNTLAGWVDAVKEGSTSLSGTQVAVKSSTVKIGIRDTGALTHPWNGMIDESRIYLEEKTGSWFQAEFDASPKGGQIFFSWSGPETTAVTQNLQGAANLAVDAQVQSPT